METLKVRYDGTVRNDTDDVVQFIYGEDGMDAIWIEGQDVSLMKMSYDEMKKKFKHDYDKPSYGSGWLSENHSLKDWFTKFYQGELKEDRDLLDDEYEILEKYKKQLCTEVYTDGESKQNIPIPIARIIET